MKKIRKVTPVTVTLKRAVLRRSELADVIGGTGKNGTHSVDPQNLTHRVQPR